MIRPSGIAAPRGVAATVTQQTRLGPPASGRHAGRPALQPRSVKVRRHLFTEELQRFHDALMRDLCAAIHLAQNPVEAERLLQPHQAIRHPLGRADDELVAQRFVIGDRLQPPAARGAILDRRPGRGRCA